MYPHYRAKTGRSPPHCSSHDRNRHQLRFLEFVRAKAYFPPHVTRNAFVSQQGHTYLPSSCSPVTLAGPGDCIFPATGQHVILHHRKTTLLRTGCAINDNYHRFRLEPPEIQSPCVERQGSFREKTRKKFDRAFNSEVGEGDCGSEVTLQEKPIPRSLKTSDEHQRRRNKKHPDKERRQCC